jgi:hypothetical protein
MTSDSSIGGSGWSVDDVTISRNVSLESTFRARGGATATSTSTVQVQPPPPNDEPEIAVNAGVTLVQGEAVSITQAMLQAADADPADTLIYTVTAGPSEGQLVPASGFTQDEIDSGSVTYQHSGSESLSDAFTFEVNDGRGGTAGPATFAITLTPSNAPPSLGITSVPNAVPNQLYVLTLTPTDPNPEDSLTLAVDAGPPWLSASVEDADGQWRLSGIPAPSDLGSSSLTLRVSDDGSPARESSQTFELIVQPQVDAVPAVGPWGQIGVGGLLLTTSVLFLQHPRFNRRGADRSRP